MVTPYQIKVDTFDVLKNLKGKISDNIYDFLLETSSFYIKKEQTNIEREMLIQTFKVFVDQNILIDAILQTVKDKEKTAVNTLYKLHTCIYELKLK